MFFKVQVVGGYPCLTEKLTWPNLPFFIAGKAALLQLGPCAGNEPHNNNFLIENLYLTMLLGLI